MKILITGSHGFIGKNLICELKNKGYNDLCFCGRETGREELEHFAKDCDFVFHLAGVNRPLREEEFMEGNCDFTRVLIDTLKKAGESSGKMPPLLCASSTQAALDNPYGKSKLAGEELLLEYERETGAKVFIYRLTNVFGKWCKPDYNSAVATFCNNIAKGLPIQISDESRQMELVYIDNVVEAFTEAMESCKQYKLLTHSKGAENGRLTVNISYDTTLGEIVGLINGFKESRTTLQAPDMGSDFTKKLYSTYLSYLPEGEFSYPLKMNEDARGSFTEILKSQSFGQVSVNISKTCITKGNHWHHTKNEKFLVVSGTGVIRFRKVIAEGVGAEKVIEYHVNGDKLQVIDIPPGYTHNIENLGTGDLVTIMWANESFNSEKPDTYFLEV